MYVTQQIEIKTVNGAEMQLAIDRQAGWYRLSNAQHRDANQTWAKIEGLPSADSKAEALFEQVIAASKEALAGKGDAISTVSNPCNAHLVPAAIQKKIFQNLAIAAEVLVNGSPA
jgi:hypothetical protein